MSKVEETEVSSLARVYPHVDDIEDWRAQQSIRLLWDRVFELTAQLKAAQATVGDLVNAQHAQDDQLVAAHRKADEALAIAQLTGDEKGEVITGGGGTTQISVAGQFWLRSNKVYRPLYMSGFKLPALALSNPQGMKDYLDMVASLGFTGVRVLAGRLTWGPQSPADAIAGLPIVLSEAIKRKLAVEVTVLTDTNAGDGSNFYDPVAHTDAIGKATAVYSNNAISEVANEPYHGTQSNAVHDFNNLATWGNSYLGMRGLSWACGAPDTDQPDPTTRPISGPYITIHLSRGGELWHMVRRVRELATVSAKYNKAVMNGEPIGWGPVEQPGRRTTNTNIAFAMGCLSRGFEVGLVSHADHGLQCTMPSTIETQCHQAAVAGFSVFGTETRLRFEDVDWANSPIASANIEAGVVNVYSFMDSDSHGWAVLVGLSGDPGIAYKNNFGKLATTAQRPGIEVWEVGTGGQLPLIAPNMQHEVQATINANPDIDTTNDAERGVIIDITAWRINGGNNAGPWGRKSKNSSGTDLNTDGLTYKRPDGKFEIYDCLSGTTDGVSTWDPSGPYNPGENGWWWPAPQPPA